MFVFTKTLKTDVSADFLHSSFNVSIKKSDFATVSKQANVKPVFKKWEI